MKKNVLQKGIRKALALGMALTFLCFASACGMENNEDPSGSTGDMAGTTGTNQQNDGVLDKGGANPTDNNSLIDDRDDVNNRLDDDNDLPINPDINPGLNNGDGLIDDANDAVDDVMDSIHNGIDDLSSPNGGNSSTTNNGIGGNNGNDTGIGTGISTGNGAGTGTGAR